MYILPLNIAPPCGLKYKTVNILSRALVTSFVGVMQNFLGIIQQRIPSKNNWGPPIYQNISYVSSGDNTAFKIMQDLRNLVAYHFDICNEYFKAKTCVISTFLDALYAYL